MTQLDTLQKHFRTLRMPTAYEVIGEVITSAQRESWSLEAFTRELLEQELEGRRQRRIERLKKACRLARPWLPLNVTVYRSSSSDLSPRSAAASSSTEPRIF